MWKQKIGISLSSRYNRPMNEVIEIIAATGFDSVSPIYGAEMSIGEICKKARSLGLEIGFLHAPFGKTADLWCCEENKRTQALNELIDALRECGENSIPTMVVHTWIGFGCEPCITDEGFASFDLLVDRAESCGVKIAFENTEGDEYLMALMERYRGREIVGFCWDSGHEMCYNGFRDMLAMYGDRLFVTHLNDNLGVSRFDGEIFWTDDLHLLPGDGIADWEAIVQRLKRSKPIETINFELAIISKPGRHENDKYTQMSYEQYFAEAYARACKIAHKYTIS